ncbi:hypothetical protein C8R46DRAFT_181180 [Mycena filopes]|nr:hypothetical protein C8R46DRAFT_181180 [Mycena filopes]
MNSDIEAPSSPKRVEELWFADGNIVLQAGNSQYRVYHGVLAARSPIFQDMLSFPQPSNPDLVDGCPLVCLPDSEAEVTIFLRAIFEPEFFMPFPSRTTFDTAAACLRLSHKYEVAYLRRRALVHLSSAYDTKLSRWDKGVTIDDEDEVDVDDLVVSNIISWPWPDDAALDIYAIKLFREVDALWLLPNAFYNLSAAFEELGRNIFHGTTYNDTPTTISIEDQTSFAAGHAVQIRSAVTDILRFLTDPLDIAGCTSATECPLERFRAIGEIGKTLRSGVGVPLDVWDADDWKMLANLCPVCLATLKENHTAARQAFWDKLPAMYGLPSWPELEKMKVAAIGTSWIS